MCASFMIRQNTAEDFPIKVETRTDWAPFLGQVIVPHRQAPVIVLEAASSVPILKSMRFSLIPHWSKEAKLKFATHNARLETITEKPTWREAFRKRHCLVPMTDFIEPVYTGDLAGNMVAFHRDDRGWLFAAGIWEEWTNRETGEVIESFAIITTEPPDFVARTGHDRCPAFLRADRCAQWLQSGPVSPADLLALLEKPAFAVERHRPLKAGWEKRRPNN